MDKKISIYIVEDYLLTRITYKHSFKKYEDIEIKGDFESAEECIEAMKSNPADVVLMDLGLPYMTGIEATKTIKETFPSTKVIILTSHESENEVLASLASGANAYALKDISIDNLSTLIRSVNIGALWLDPRIAKVAFETFQKMDINGTKTDFNLTAREKEVLKLIVEGLSNNEIAKEIVVSPNTAKAHVGNILNKLAVTDRVQAAVKAIKYDLY